MEKDKDKKINLAVRRDKTHTTLKVQVSKGKRKVIRKKFDGYR